MGHPEHTTFSLALSTARDAAFELRRGLVNTNTIPPSLPLHYEDTTESPAVLEWSWEGLYMFLNNTIGSDDVCGRYDGPGCGLSCPFLSYLDLCSVDRALFRRAVALVVKLYGEDGLECQVCATLGLDTLRVSPQPHWLISLRGEIRRIVSARFSNPHLPMNGRCAFCLGWAPGPFTLYWGREAFVSAVFIVMLSSATGDVSVTLPAVASTFTSASETYFLGTVSGGVALPLTLSGTVVIVQMAKEPEDPPGGRPGSSPGGPIVRGAAEFFAHCIQGPLFTARAVTSRIPAVNGLVGLPPIMYRGIGLPYAVHDGSVWIANELTVGSYVFGSRWGFCIPETYEMVMLKGEPAKANNLFSAGLLAFSIPDVVDQQPWEHFLAIVGLLNTVALFWWVTTADSSIWLLTANMYSEVGGIAFAGVYQAIYRSLPVSAVIDPINGVLYWGRDRVPLSMAVLTLESFVGLSVFMMSTGGGFERGSGTVLVSLVLILATFALGGAFLDRRVFLASCLTAYLLQLAGELLFVDELWRTDVGQVVVISAIIESIEMVLIIVTLLRGFYLVSKAKSQDSQSATEAAFATTAVRRGWLSSLNLNDMGYKGLLTFWLPAGGPKLPKGITRSRSPGEGSALPWYSGTSAHDTGEAPLDGVLVWDPRSTLRPCSSHVYTCSLGVTSTYSVVSGEMVPNLNSLVETRRPLRCDRDPEDN